MVPCLFCGSVKCVYKQIRCVNRLNRLLQCVSRAAGLKSKKERKGGWCCMSREPAGAVLRERKCRIGD